MELAASLQTALNEQLKRELIAHFLYKAMAMDLYHKGYDGFAAWMDNHATEEYGHFERIVAYLKDKGARVILPELPKPTDTWPGVKEAIQAALGHEQKLTRDIHDLCALAEKEGDLSTLSMLDWFVNEQVEEEHMVGRLLKRIELAGGQPAALLALDGQVAARGE